MENETGIEEAETMETNDIGVEVESEGVPTQDDSYDADYKDDYSVPTEADAEDIAEQEEPEYTEDDINEAMMDYIKENYEMPDKFQDVESLINSYKHLESKMGSMTGAPDTYELEGDIFDNYSDSVLEGVVGQAKEMGLSNDGLNQLLDTAMKSQAQEQEANWEMEKHKMGQNADREIADAMQYLGANFTPEQSETLQGMVQTADQFYALRDLIQGNKPSAPAPTQRTSQPTNDADIQNMLFAKDSFGNLKMESDSQYARKVNGMMQNNW